jgi:hypothetical protein
MFERVFAYLVEVSVSAATTPAFADCAMDASRSGCARLRGRRARECDSRTPRGEGMMTLRATAFSLLALGLCGCHATDVHAEHEPVASKSAGAQADHAAHASPDRKGFHLDLTRPRGLVLSSALVEEQLWVLADVYASDAPIRSGKTASDSRHRGARRGRSQGLFRRKRGVFQNRRRMLLRETNAAVARADGVNSEADNAFVRNEHRDHGFAFSITHRECNPARSEPDDVAHFRQDGRAGRC